jgi:hypothetical protein
LAGLGAACSLASVVSCGLMAILIPALDMRTYRAELVRLVGVVFVCGMVGVGLRTSGLLARTQSMPPVLSITLGVCVLLTAYLVACVFLKVESAARVFDRMRNGLRVSGGA